MGIQSKIEINVRPTSTKKEIIVLYWECETNINKKKIVVLGSYWECETNVKKKSKHLARITSTFDSPNCRKHFASDCYSPLQGRQVSLEVRNNFWRTISSLTFCRVISRLSRMSLAQMSGNFDNTDNCLVALSSHTSLLLSSSSSLSPTEGFFVAKTRRKKQ